MSETREIEIVRVPGWERFPWLRAGFSTRAGGMTDVYGRSGAGGTLNLGWTKEDDAARVGENRRRFGAAVMGRETRLAGLRQVHSDVVRVLERGDDGELRWEGVDGPALREDGRPLAEGDGLMTDVPGVLLAAGVADCTPVLVADTRQRVVAALHAGWRGTVAGIVEQGVGLMRERYGTKPEDLVAAVGPAAGSCCYEVGEEVREEFERRLRYGADLFRRAADVDAGAKMRPETKLYLDLWEANRRQLMDAGVAEGNIWVALECTLCAQHEGERKYFSHRAEGGFTGRGLGAIGIFAE